MDIEVTLTARSKDLGPTFELQTGRLAYQTCLHFHRRVRETV